MPKNKNFRFDSKCVHSSIWEYEYEPAIPPIYQTSTFRFTSVEQGQSFSKEKNGYVYSRMRNTTIEAMENAIAELEEGIIVVKDEQIYSLMRKTLNQSGGVLKSK